MIVISTYKKLKGCSIILTVRSGLFSENTQVFELYSPLYFEVGDYSGLRTVNNSLYVSYCSSFMNH